MFLIRTLTLILKKALTTGIVDVVRSRRHGSNAALTEAVSSTEGDTIPSRKGLPEKQRERDRGVPRNSLEK